MKKGNALSQETIITFIIILIVLIVIALYATGAFDTLIGALKDSAKHSTKMLKSTPIQ